MFSLEDVQKHAMFKSLIKSATFNVGGNGVISAANLMLWFDSLEKKIAESAKQNIPVSKEIAELKAKKK